jgi:hypothetical protein
LVLLLAAPLRADEGWVNVDKRDGVIYERRAVPGSRFYAYRATLALSAPPSETARAVWTAITDSVPSTVKKRTVLSRSDDELVVYEQISTPVVSDRDVTLRFRRVVRPDAIEIQFQSVNELGPPPAAGLVRLPVVRGRWSLTPTASGTHVVYECFSEPGGSVPAFLVRGGQQSQVAKDVERALSGLRGTH